MEKTRRKSMLSVFLAGTMILSGLNGNTVSAASKILETPQAQQVSISTEYKVSNEEQEKGNTILAADTTKAPESTPISSPASKTQKADSSQAPSTQEPKSTATPVVTPAPSASAAPVSTKNPFTGSKYTHSESQNGKNIFLGIDVSYHQGTIDWAKVKAAGVQFVILRLGYRGYGTGTLNLDKKFRTYAQGATDAGLPIGLYFYTEAISETEAREEANFCIEQAKDFKITMPVAYDFEPATNKNGRLLKANLSKSKATNLCRAFCTAIKEAGYTPMIYSNKSDLNNRIDGASLGKEYKIWLANYTTKTTYAGDYEYWQYSSSGKVNGISGEVDCNFLYTINTIPDATNNKNIADARISSISKKIYNGKEKTPAITVTYKNETLTEGTDYIVSYENNTQIGSASVIITGINDFTGTNTQNFKIVPKYVVNFVQTDTTEAKTIQLKWSKRGTATGYLLYRKATLNGTTYKKIATLESNTTTNFTDAKRAANRTFYYAIRSYTEINGTRYYSKYTYLSAATNPPVASQKVKKATKLYESEDLKDANNKMLIKIPKKSSILHLGKVYLNSTEFVYHVAYCINETTHEGYIAGDTQFTS